MKKSPETDLQKKFTSRLMAWNRELNMRQMPWKGEQDPYKIWLSEIILQQTRVEQGLGYYNRFIKKFPDIHQLAKATDQKIFKMWEGLGYYTRCRNLVATARQISKERKGKFPATYDEIKALKGVGPYTAAAIASFAFNLPHAVVDGNVYRVLARFFGVHKPVDTTEGKKYFSALAEQLLDKKKPGLYNQAIMDFGATVCRPVSPLCGECIFRKNCFAFINNQVDELPVKKKKVRIRKRWFYYFVMVYMDTIAIRKRTAKDIWQDLYEFPLIETPGPTGVNLVLNEAIKNNWAAKNVYTMESLSQVYKQQLSHQLINARFIKLILKKKHRQNNEWLWVNKQGIVKYAFPQIVNQYLLQSGNLSVSP